MIISGLGFLTTSLWSTLFHNAGGGEGRNHWTTDFATYRLSQPKVLFFFKEPLCIRLNILFIKGFCWFSLIIEPISVFYSSQTTPYPKMQLNNLMFKYILRLSKFYICIYIHVLSPNSHNISNACNDKPL